MCRALKPIISERRPFAEIVAIHRQGGTRHGKLAIIVNETLSAK